MAKYEKTNFLTKIYNNRNLEYIFHFFNVLATLFLLSRSSFFPITLQSLSHLYSLFLNNSFFAFLLLNSIILFLYILSNQNDNVSDETYKTCLKITASELVTDPHEKHSYNSCSVFEKTVTAVTETTTTTTTTCCTRLTKSKDVDNEASVEKCYRRVKSESYDRSYTVVDQRRRLKRNKTCVKKEPLRRLCYVEELSEEEFNRTVEDFIAKHKRMQREEELRSEKTEYLALDSIKGN